MADTGRTTQQSAEVLFQETAGTVPGRVTQQSAEVLFQETVVAAPGRVTQICAEVLVITRPPWTDPSDNTESADGTDDIHNNRGIIHETRRGVGNGKKYSSVGDDQTDSIQALNNKMSTRLFPPRYYVGDEDF